MAGMSSVIQMIQERQLRWTGHVTRMDHSRLPKAVFYSELQRGKRPRGRPKLRYKDTLERTLKACRIDVEDKTVCRSQWRQIIRTGTAVSEDARTAAAIETHRRRHAASPQVTCSDPSQVCSGCGRVCHSRIGLLSHKKACQKR